MTRMSHYECYFDASCTPDISRCAYCVITDGQITHTHVHEKKIGTSHKAERHALYLLLQYIEEHFEKGTKVEIYGDEKTVIERIVRRGQRSKRDKAGRLFDRMDPHYELTLQHIPRKQNRIAHSLSRIGHIPAPQNPVKFISAGRKRMLLNDIIIPNHMKYGRPPGQIKYQSRLLFYQKYGKPHKAISVNSKGLLLDGYISYLILQEHGIKECLVNVRERKDNPMLDLKIIGEGATTKIYRDGSTAIKLYADMPPCEAENEAERQTFAYNAGLPVPAVIGIRRLDGTNVALDMEYIDGKPLFYPKMDTDERRAAIHTLVKLQCLVHAVDARGQPGQAYRLTQKIDRTRHLDEPCKIRLLMLLDRLDAGAENLCHGDFHPLNILYDGEKHWIIDWVDATAGSPLADACRTYLIFKQHMSRSAGIYLRQFCKEANVKQEDVLAWLPIVAAGRLDEKQDDESRQWLLSHLNEMM